MNERNLRHVAIPVIAVLIVAAAGVLISLTVGIIGVIAMRAILVSSRPLRYTE